jgi:hypothetical protein
MTLARSYLLGILGILMFAIILGQGILYYDSILDTSQYEYKVIIYDGFNTVYYTNKPPMMGGSSVWFIDAQTGLVVLEIGQRITVKQQFKPTPKPK